MKKLKKLFVIACLGGVGYLLAKLLKTDAAQEKLFENLRKYPIPWRNF